MVTQLLPSRCGSFACFCMAVSRALLVDSLRAVSCRHAKAWLVPLLPLWHAVKVPLSLSSYCLTRYERKPPGTVTTTVLLSQCYAHLPQQLVEAATALAAESQACDWIMRLLTLPVVE